jgi:acyl-CoA synthetase (AMP-forming)/AMP-acid ligase II
VSGPDSLPGCLAHWARATPNAPFIVDRDGTLSYADTSARVRALTVRLQAAGLASGDRALMFFPNGAGFVCAWLAINAAGATAVPVHSLLPPKTLATLLAAARTSLAVGSRSALAPFAAELERHGVARLELDDRAAIWPADASGEAEPRGDGARAPSTILYTSGTTGNPKGVVIGHASYLAAAREMTASIGIGPDDRIFTGLPLYHANPQFYAVASALGVGASVAVARTFDARTFVREALDLGATGFTYVGTVLALLLRHPLPETSGQLRFCTGGGAPLPIWRDIEAGLGVRVHELYGASETGSFVTLNTRTHSRIGTTGRARPDVEVVILDAGDEIVGPGVAGEIAVRPRRPGVLFDGYFNAPELTLARLGNYWFHTGDEGRLDEDGYLTFLGRKDDRIRRGGENVDPRAVEAALLSHPDIREAAVVGVEDELMGHEVKAVLVAADSFDVATLPEHLHDRLPRFAQPRFVELRAVLPTTSTQKLSVTELREERGLIHDLRRRPN